ncbi:hypothetical protein TNCV_3373601 [Trichonephila clavipes]|nr:hypothetical protein TNCV_3373601 [Trichonephila clavipes]
MQILPHVLHVSEPVQIPDDPEPVQIPVSQVPEPPVQIPLVQIPDVPEHVQIPMSQVPQPPMQILPEPMNILHVSEPVQIPDDEPVNSSVTSPSHLCRFHLVQIPDIPVSQVPQPPADAPRTSTCADSTCSRTCADSNVTSPTATYADSPRTYEHSTCIRTCADSQNLCRFQCHKSQKFTCADSTYADSTCSRTCADSNVTSPPQPPMQILPEPMNILHVSEPVQIPDDPEPVQIPVSQVPQPPMQILPEPMNILHVPQHVPIPVSQVPQPPMQILPEPMNILHVSEPVQIPDDKSRTCADSSVQFQMSRTQSQVP